MTDISFNLRRINLNLLPVLLEILRTRNITRASKSLCLTQSATSGCLRRLRELFGDELLIPRGREMMLTDKAKQLLPLLEEAMLRASSLIGAPTFDPLTDSSRFRVATTDWVAALLISGISGTLQERAPKVSIEFVQHSLTNMVADLKKGQHDLLIGPKEMQEWANLNVFDENADYSIETIFDDRMVGIESSLAPCPNVDKDLDAYLNHPHVTFSLFPGMHGSLERQAIVEQGLSQWDQFLIPQFAVLPYLVATTGAISVVPESLAKRFSSIFPIRIFEPPIKFRPINLMMVWAKAREKDERLKWLRGEIRKSFEADPQTSFPGFRSTIGNAASVTPLSAYDSTQLVLHNRI